MFYDEEKAIKECSEEPSLVFQVIKEGHMQLLEKILKKKIVSVNTTDDAGNDIVCRLLKAREYDMVIKCMKDKEWDVNHQNKDGNTFAHILVSINYLHVIKIIEQLRKNKKFIPNIKNKRGETILDKSINGNYIYTTVKILSDNRFNNIDLLSFKKIYNTYIKSTYYGKYSKLNNLEIIVKSLEKKDTLLPTMEKLLELIKVNKELIKKELLKNKSKNLETIINSLLVEFA